MNKLENIYNIYIKIKLPIVIKRLNEDVINNYIYSIKYLLHNIIKKCDDSKGYQEGKVQFIDGIRKIIFKN